MRWAAPSCCVPANVARSAAFLAGKAPGIALCLFEAQACLAYGAAELPPELADLPLAWHLHLPADLDWRQGGAAAAAVCIELYNKCRFLKPELAILHPPLGAGARQKLAEFARAWKRMTPIAVENIAGCDLIGLGLDFLAAHGFSICLDVAHAMALNQSELLASCAAERAAALHWSAPAGADRHAPLLKLNEAERGICRAIMARAQPGALHVIEIFNWQGIEQSLPLLQSFRTGGKP